MYFDHDKAFDTVTDDASKVSAGGFWTQPCLPPKL